MAGLDLKQFLEDERGSRGRWLRSWRDKKTNPSLSIVVWFHCVSGELATPRYSHQFLVEDEVEDRESRKPKQILRYPRFVGVDPPSVYDNQYFRDKDTDLLKVLPDRDPFLLLREWLRGELRASRLRGDDVVFQWHDPEKRQDVPWHADVLAGTRKRSGLDSRHSLDAKLEYVFLVVEDANPKAGPQVAVETQLLADKVRKEIKRQIDKLGDVEGNPIGKHPYAFKWVFNDKAKSPMDYYDAYRWEAEYRDDVYQAITSTDFPDVEPYTQPGEDDLVKVRAAFEAAAQVELPLDAVFSDDPQVRRQVARGELGAGKVAARVRPAAAQPAARGGVASPRPPGGTSSARVQQPQGAPAPVRSLGPQVRQRKQKADAPPPPPSPEATVPCDECGTPMALRQEKCPKCGAEYDVLEELDDGDAKAASLPGGNTEGVVPPQDDAGNAGGGNLAEEAAEACFSCGSRDLARKDGKVLCSTCGIDQGSDLPFG